MRLKRQRLGRYLRSGSSRMIRDACGSTNPIPPRTARMPPVNCWRPPKLSPKYRDGMTKRPSSPSIKITYVNGGGEPQEISVREIFCRMDGDALVLTKFETADGEKVKDLPITVPLLGDLDADLDDADRLHEIAMAQLGDVPSPAAEMEPEQESPRPAPARERRRPSGPLRQYDEAANPAPAAGALKTPTTPAPAPRGPAVMPPVTKGTGATTGPPADSTVRAASTTPRRPRCVR